MGGSQLPLHHGGEELVEPVGPALEIEPAEQGLQGGGSLILPTAGPLGDRVGGGVSAPAEDIRLLLGEQGEQIVSCLNFIMKLLYRV